MRTPRTDVAGVEHLDELLSPAEPEPRKPLASRLGAFVGAALLVALAAGTLSAPVGMAASDAAGAAIGYWNSLPGDLPLDVALPQHTVLLDKDGKEFARFYSENRIDVKLADISHTFTDALIATEDSRFYEHGPIDIVGTVRAMVHNTGSDATQGASGITQQLVKNLLIAQNGNTATASTLGTKLQELKYAAGLEKRLSKDQILEMYANTVYFGNGAYGIEAAARIYFDTTAAKLSPAQGATLAGILRGPSMYDPVAHPDAAKDRRDTVLGRLAATGKLTPAAQAAAAAEPLGLKRGSLPNGCAKSDYPFFCQMVKQEILTDPAFGASEEARQDRLARGGMVLTTTLDRKAMDVAQDAVTGALGNGNRAALGVAVVRPGTGQIAAIAENRAWGSGPGQTEMIYAQSPFQVGSSMKPITLATALEQGIPATTKLLSNSPYTSPTLDSPPGGFQNYGGVSYGMIDAREAIKSSVNTYFIQLIQKTGVLPVADMAARLGITSLPRTGPNAIKGQEASLTLGAYEISPLEMANAYATFIGGGIECTPVAITAGVRADTGAKVPVPDPACHQAIAPAVANTVADALKQPLTSTGTLYALHGLSGGRPAGAKTGTTNDFAANWTVGVTPQWATAVWLGDPRGGAAHPLDAVSAYGTTFHDLTGSEVAAPVWKAVMDGISAGMPVLPMPNADDAATSTSTVRSVPDVRGLSVDQATTLLLQDDLVPSIAADAAPANPLYGKDVAVAQTPAPGSAVGYRQAVTITLSNGSDTAVRIPEKK